MRQRLCAVAVLVLFVASPIPVRAQTASLATATDADIGAGQRVFAAQCAPCHGAGGTGGMGPDLRRATLRHAANDGALLQLIRAGIPATEMPPFSYALAERAVWQVAAYVRSLGRIAPAEISGNAQRGAALYESNGCAACHVVRGGGGVLGPELTSIGAIRGASYLRESVIKPEAAHPRGFLVVRAVTKSGLQIRGIRVIEDVFWVHIRDAGGVVHTLSKSELTILERLPDESLMPSYASQLSGNNLDDLVAYLSTLRGIR